VQVRNLGGLRTECPQFPKGGKVFGLCEVLGCPGKGGSEGDGKEQAVLSETCAPCFAGMDYNPVSWTKYPILWEGCSYLLYCARSLVWFHLDWPVPFISVS
jgi:hypothetical protein